ncbi:MAG: DUF1822 family protein [Microcoleus sp. PH2017_10_PVI_O_A]|uniref:DUF1822 family protein n=1 Tax=unclassified Microcoleus TaxID=2642155 RepID=UPI001DC4CE00|nr:MULTISPECIES: DUF1822 family protein [unclassified Microcoleus]MCC3409209.1 DUF1822 family protein [Microcoleus sp. PH2017_10_PVI_O_A]MCC3463447.1 DUF1822 family protein [Microcoleus sp. PH2017_11_PCY_U_A]MCC3481279.1 DUF1822 family protein [Microcoleus sp. PH2017_12_PCY_D_A]MCC3531306.1 DUF1822 family protein [Microcoleus sp. PH2017_21_RUC_O_A]MCC3543583.1 DUF1822 family protein [Microcoleus sp. PH2017_22_RUC_O_B]
MNGNLNNIRQSSIPLPITTAALRLAEKFSNIKGLSTAEKRDQVYFNTLAVCAVKDYMEMMDIPTDLNASDSWNPAMRLYTDAADLKLTQLGNLECRPVKSGKFCDIPLEIPDDRIGLVAVEIDIKRQEATLVGFMKTAITGELAIERLQSIEKLLVHLDGLERSQKPVQLRQWLHNIFEAGWQSVAEVLAPPEPSLAFRYGSAVVRAKTIHLTPDISELAPTTLYSFRGKPNLDRGVGVPAESVALLVAIAPTTDTDINIKVQVHPIARADSLSLNLTLKLIDGGGMTVMEACAVKKDNGCMTLEFAADRGECFSVVVKLKELYITENFAA